MIKLTKDNVDSVLVSDTMLCIVCTDNVSIMLTNDVVQSIVKQYNKYNEVTKKDTTPAKFAQGGVIAAYHPGYTATLQPGIKKGDKVEVTGPNEHYRDKKYEVVCVHNGSADLLELRHGAISCINVPVQQLTRVTT